MNKIEITNNTITYHSEYHGIHKDKSWNLDLDNVLVIGGINRMDGDDDSDFIVLIDKSLQKNFLNLTWKIEGLNEFKSVFERKFEIGLNDWSIDFYDKEKIIYPRSLSEHQLYRKFWKKKFRTAFAIDHIADGELTEEIIEYLKKKNAINKG